MLAHVRETLLHDAEDLDLLVGGEVHAGVDVELDVERAVGGEELDIPAQRRVERRRAARGREREDGEAGLLLCEQRRLFQSRQRVLGSGAGLEHRRVRRHGEEVLRQAVVDLACDARSLLGHRAAELRETDRAPRADEDDDVREHAEKVPLRDPVARDQRLEHELERGEEHEREAEGEPAREVVLADAEASMISAWSASVPVR